MYFYLCIQTCMHIMSKYHMYMYVYYDIHVHVHITLVPDMAIEIMNDIDTVRQFIQSHQVNRYTLLAFPCCIVCCFIYTCTCICTYTGQFLHVHCTCTVCNLNRNKITTHPIFTCVVTNNNIHIHVYMYNH